MIMQYIKQRKSCTVLLKNEIILQRASRVCENKKKVENYLHINMISSGVLFFLNFFLS